MQWPRAVAQFTSRPHGRGHRAGLPDRVPELPVARASSTTRRSRSAGVAALRWAAERAAATGAEPEEVDPRGRALRGRGRASAGTRELRRITADGQARDRPRRARRACELAQLLSATAQERVAAAASPPSVGAIVLDECHHLASLWGYVVRAVLGELAATRTSSGSPPPPPAELTTDEAELYAELLGPVDFVCRPRPWCATATWRRSRSWRGSPSRWTRERDWLAEHDTRFRELITALHDDVEGAAVVPGLGDRAGARAPPRRRRRRRGPVGGVPAPAPRAGAGRRPLPRLGRAWRCPPSAPRGEAYRAPPDLDDWLVLLEDYALRCLADPGSPEAAERYNAVAAALRAARASSSRGEGIRRGAVGGRPAADRLAGQGDRPGRGAWPPRPRSAATGCGRWCCATPRWPRRGPTTR